MKPIIIAGNGPSLAQIDYSRLPQDFDVFRCNQFYFEDKYFLGKKIKGVFFNPFVLKEQFFTLHHLKERGEYEVEDVYCNITMGIWDREWSNGRAKDLEQELKYDFPSVKNTYPFLEQMHDFNALHKFFALYYEKRFTTGIVMLVVALAQGYKEIYLTGIDFYEGGGLSYAFDVEKKNLIEKVSFFAQKDFKDNAHERNVDIQAIKLALQMQDVKLYSLNPQSTLATLIPLAPKIDSNFSLISKPSGYICDFVPLPQNDRKHICKNPKEAQEEASAPPPTTRLKIFLQACGITKNNFWVKICLDFLELIKGGWKILKKFKR